ncbi:MAG: coenzyme A pyrophosphatase [Acidobacteria bacterium]|nr:MAG: coenzyme A pyrophosphatase [Acidobacteriota bacterium]
MPADNLQRSAVLIPVIEAEGFPLLYTKRSAAMRHHAGQISFPGGRQEEGESSWQCALREAGEEVGLQAAGVTYLGRIDDVLSPQGFHVACHVGLIDDFKPVLNPAEVERVFRVPLSFIFKQAWHEVKPWQTNSDVSVHYFHFPECLVWGVTGQITFRLMRALTKVSEKAEWS